jgi:hypothetical protein
MKHTLLRFGVVCVFTLVSVAQNLRETSPREVDLTLPVTQESISDGRGVPGFSNLSPVTLLPLILKIASIQPTTVRGKPGVYLRVALQNLSDKIFEFPTGRDVQVITAASRPDRKEFAFRLRALCDKCDRKQFHTVALTASSSSLPDTRIPLRPGEQVYVKLFVDTSVFHLTPAEKALELQIGCQETNLEDGRYVIKSRSNLVWVDVSISDRLQSGAPEVN